MAVPPSPAGCSAAARASTSRARPWSRRRATGAQHRSSSGTLVRVLAPPVKAGVSQGRQARRATASYHAICGARYSVPHRVSTLSVQASPRHGSDSIASANIGRSVTRSVVPTVLSCQCFEQRLGLLEGCGVKALGEPCIDRRQERTVERFPSVAPRARVCALRTGPHPPVWASLRLTVRQPLQRGCLARPIPCVPYS